MKNVLIIIGAVLLGLVISWAVVSFFYWLITLCFGLDWSLLHGTGVWLIMVLVGMVFGTAGVKITSKN